MDPDYTQHPNDESPGCVLAMIFLVFALVVLMFAVLLFGPLLTGESRGSETPTVSDEG